MRFCIVEDVGEFGIFAGEQVVPEDDQVGTQVHFARFSSILDEGCLVQCWVAGDVEPIKFFVRSILSQSQMAMRVNCKLRLHQQ